MAVEMDNTWEEFINLLVVQVLFMRQPFQFGILCPSLTLLLTAGVLGAIAPAAIAQVPPQTTTQTAAQSVDPAIAEQHIAEQFADLVASGQYEEARQYLHPVLASEWTADVLEERWTTFQNRTGVFIRRGDARSIGQLVFVPAEFANLSEDLIFIFDDEHRINGIDFPLQPVEFVGE